MARSEGKGDRGIAKSGSNGERSGGYRERGVARGGERGVDRSGKRGVARSGERGVVKSEEKRRERCGQRWGSWNERCGQKWEKLEVC